MIASPLEELIANRARLMPLTVEQYHKMLETGILRDGDPYELLDGYLVRKDSSAAGADPMTIGPDHTGGVELLGELETDLKAQGFHLRLQQPVTILPDSEPEPDGAIVGGTVRYWATAGRHPCETSGDLITWRRQSSSCRFRALAFLPAPSSGSTPSARRTSPHRYAAGT